MKKYLIYPVTILAGICMSSQIFAQQPDDLAPKKEKKEKKEIIIRKNGDKEEKLNVEVNGDSVLINGKPLSEYHDGDVSVLEKDELENGPDKIYFSQDNQPFEYLNMMKDEEPHSFLGVVTEKSADGVKITEVVKGSAAEKSGLAKGDIITKVDDKNVTTPDDLIKAVRSYKPGDEIKIVYLHDGKKKESKTKLGETKSQRKNFMFKNFAPGSDMNAFNFKTPMPPPNAFSGPRNFYDFKYHTDKPKVGLKIEDTENSDGVKVLSVEENSPADKAGLKKDDIITEINGDKISGVEDAMDQMGDAEEGATIKVKAMRNNSETNFEIKIPKKLNQANL